MYTGTKVMATGIIYNTDLVKTVPASWKDLTGDSAKDNVIMPNPLYSGAAAYNLGAFTRNEEFGWKFYEDFKAVKPEVVKGNGGVMEAVSGGQKGYGMVVDYLAIRAKKDGAPVEFIYPGEGVPVITEPVGIVKGTEEEDMAKGFVDFILSEEGQKLQSELGYAPIRNGFKGPEGLKSAEELTKILTADTKELLKGREEDKKKFDEIFSAQ